MIKYTVVVIDIEGEITGDTITEPMLYAEAFAHAMVISEEIGDDYTIIIQEA